jgi:predicted SAM-dependent methyltransferase
MKLNIGSSNPEGIYRSPEWINIDNGDGRFSGNVFKVDALAMPGEWDGYFDEVHAVHVLEHVNRNKRFDFVVACRRVLKPGGVLYLEVPDFEKVIRNLLGAIDGGDHELEHRMTTGLFGKQRYEGDSHRWGFTSRTLKELAERAKFSSIDVFRSIQGTDHMISTHFIQEPVLLLKAFK